MEALTSASLRNLFLAAAIGLSLPFAVAESPASSRSVTDAQAFGRTLPLVFEENRGQADSGVRFLAHTPMGEMRFSADQVQLPCPASRPIALKIRGGGDSAHLEAEKPTGGVANYYPSKDRSGWIERLPLNSQIRYAQVAPGVDLLFHGETGSLEYDIEVAPDGDPSAVALEVEGGGSFRLENDGSATVQIARGCQSLHLLAPRAFQTVNGHTVQVSSRFTLDEDGRLAFALTNYDRQRRLTIDPVVSYTGAIGVNNDTPVSAIQVDAAGDVFLTGQTMASNYPVAGGGVGTIGSSASQQVYVTKLDPTGTQILYSTYIPAPGFNSAAAIALDGSGNAYVAGIAGDTGFPTTSSNLGTCSNFCNNGFVAKFNSSGTMVYSTLIGSGQQLPKGISVDSAGNVYVAGLSADNGLQTVNAFQPAYGGMECTSCGNAFFGELNPTGTAWIFSSYFSGPGQINSPAYATTIARDANGNIYFAGDGDGVPLKGSFQYSVGGSFVAEFAPDGKTLLFSTLLGGNTIQPDSVSGIQIGPDGTIYVAGSQIAQDFPYTLNAYRHPIYPIGYAQFKQYIFAIAINPNHSDYTWSTYLGQGIVSSTAIDAKGNFYVAGNYSQGSVLFKNALAADTTSGGYILELDPTGALVTATGFGGQNIGEVPAAMAIDPSGNLYIGGNAGGSNLASNGVFDPISVGTGVPYKEQSYLSSSYSPFVAKISPANQPQVSLSNTGPVLALRNAGSADLHIGSIQTGSAITSMGSTCGSTLIAGTECYLTPLATSPSETLTINSDAQPASQTFSPSGLSNSIGPVVLVDGSRLNFPPQQNGTTSSGLPLVITNVGAAPVTLTSILTFGYFTQTNNCPGTLAPESSCTAMVTVSPTTNGTGSADIGVVYGNGIRNDVFANFLQNSTDGPLLLSSDSYGLDFGNVVVGATSIVRTVTVTNSGTSAVAVNPPTISGDGASSFSISANTCSGIQLQAKASCVIAVTFQPTAVGRIAVPLLITGGGSSLTTYLVGTGFVPSNLTVTPSSADFGDVVLGSSPTQVFQVSNNTAAPIAITSIVAGMADGSATSDFSQENACASSLAAQATCSITVTFAPSMTGTRNGAVSLILNGSTNQSVSVTGTGVPVVAVTPSALTFAATPVGGSSLQSITLRNQSKSAQAFSLDIHGAFAITSTTCVSPLPVGAQCSVSVAFQPTSSGSQTSSLTVTAGNFTPETVSLTGVGGVPGLALSSGSVMFPATVDGVASAAQTLTLTNPGTAPLSSLALAVSGANAADFITTNNCGSTVAAGQTCSISVIFKPSLAASESATLTVAANAAASPLSVGLSGTGSAPNFSLAATSISAAVISTGSATYKLALQADPGFAGTVTLSCSGLPAYAACSFAPATIAFPGNGTSVLTVTTSQTQTAKVATPAIARFEIASLAAIFLLPLLRRRSFRLLCGFLIASILIGLNGCSSSHGSGTSTPGSVINSTPNGTYTFTVISSSAALSHSLSLTLTVQ